MRKLEPGRICGLYLILMCSLFMAAVSPHGYMNIVETKYAVFCVLTALFLLGFFYLFLRKEIAGRRKWDAVRLLVLAFWAWSFLSALCSPWKKIAFLGGERCDGLITVTLYCAVFLLLSFFGEHTRFPAWLPAAALSVLCLVAILQFADRNPLWLFPGELRWSGREREYNGAFLSLTGNADLTASVLCTGFAFLWPVGLRRKRWPFLLAATLCMVVLIFSEVKAGVAGALASVLLCLPAGLGLGKKGRRLYWPALALLCVIALLFVYFSPLPGLGGELHSLLHGQAEDSFGSGRIYIWKGVWRLIKERPLLGGGPDTLGERGLAFVKTAPDGATIRRTIDCAHCEAMNVAVNQGIPAMLLLAAAVILTLLRSRRCDTVACAALRSAMVAYLAASFFGIGMTANAAYFWLIWGMLLRETAKE